MTNSTIAGTLKDLSNSITAHPIRTLQKRIGEANAAKGFHADGDDLRTRTRNTTRYEGKSETFADRALRNYWISRLALITTEVAEAIEEVRNGRAIDETYYSGGMFALVDEGEPFSEMDTRDSMGNLRKPEGVPSELADVVIRAFDFAHEADIDLAAMILEKLDYNETRPHMHGKKA